MSHPSHAVDARAWGDAGDARGRALAAFALLTYAAVALHLLRFTAETSVTGFAALAFIAVVHVVYTAFFTAAAVLPAAILHALAPRSTRWGTWAVRSFAVLGTGLVHLFLLADGELFRRYGTHVNGMVWNLLTTPGGIESMDADHWSWIAFWAVVAAIFAAQAGLWMLAARWQAVGDLALVLCRPRRFGLAAVILLLGHGSERVTYGLCYGASYRPVTSVVTAYPLYQRTRLVSLSEELGLVPRRGEEGIEPPGAPTRLRYPLSPLQRRPGAKDLNVVWLVAESFRADMLTPEIMPQTWRFAAGGRRFARHYSAGNGTRMGMFGMFYGLYGSYWFPFLASTRGPVVLDALLDHGYDVEAFTSAKFTFPEFDRTIFARFPRSRLHEGDPDQLGWQNDRAQVGRLLASIDAVPAGTPFFRFEFFESPHAPYFFPEESVIRADYEPSINYVTMDLSDPAQVARIRNRYVNACRYLDSQLARVFAHLEEKGLLDSTIVILTGDHGEEFMEHGRWGHHSAFTDAQTRTPLVVRAPGVAPGVVEAMSSHLDLPATLLGLLGWENAASDFSFGDDLLDAVPRSRTIVADWDNLCLVDDAWKIVLPVKGSAWSGDMVTTAADGAVANPDAVFVAHRDEVVGVLRQLGRFGR